MIEKDNQITTIICFVLLVALIHLCLIAIPPINLEFAFVDTALYFLSPAKNKILLEQYFNYQANTLALPLLSSEIAKLLPDVDLLVLIRFLNILGIFILSTSLIILCKRFSNKNTLTVLALIILNPLVWSFSGRATADFLPMAIGVFAISLTLIRPNSMLLTLLAALLFSFAAILKYHVLSLLIIFTAIHLGSEKNKASLDRLISFYIIVISSVAFYLFKIYSIFGFWVTPPKYQVIHNLHISSVFNNFILYIGFLTLLSLPTFWISKNYLQLINKNRKILILALCFIIIFAFIGFNEVGEMNLGPLDRWFCVEARIVFLSLLGVAALFLIFESHKTNPYQREIFYVSVAILFILFIFSFSRPAQRYLILLIPFFILAIPKNYIKSRLVIFSTISIFVVTDIVIEFFRYVTAVSSGQIVEMLETTKFIAVCEPGSVESHQGNRFFGYKDNKKIFRVVSGDKSQNPDAILSTTSSIFIFKKSFSVVPIAN